MATLTKGGFMFERYTEKACQAIFFARSEAGQLGANQITAEHILLGIFRADPELKRSLFSSPVAAFTSIAKKIAALNGRGKTISDSTDLPLSSSAKRVLSLAMEGSSNLHHRQIGTEHLLLALLQAGESPAGQILADQGVTTPKILAYFNAKSRLPEDWRADSKKEFTEDIPGGLIGAIAEGFPENLAAVKEIAASLAGLGDAAQVKAQFIRLLDLLVHKGLITGEEKKGVLGEKGTS
jgi:ATP-dependent Clp protease ATP-binding subunit ClpA